MHSLQILASGLAMSFFTSVSDLPQKEQRKLRAVLRVRSLNGDSVSLLKRMASTHGLSANWGVSLGLEEQLLSVAIRDA